jgi:hypothetical protein
VESRVSGRVSDDEVETVRRLHGEGKSLSATAREMGRPTSTIALVAKRLELFWDRSKMAAAVSAKQVDNRARRAALIEAAYIEMGEIVERLRDGRGTPSKTGEFRTILKGEGGAEHTATLDFVPSVEALNLLRAFSVVAKTAVDMEKVDGDQGVEGAKSMLGNLSLGLRAVYDAARLADDQQESNPDTDGKI